MKIKAPIMPDDAPHCFMIQMLLFLMKTACNAALREENNLFGKSHH